MAGLTLLDMAAIKLLWPVLFMAYLWFTSGQICL